MPDQPDQPDQPESQSQGKSAQGLVPLLASAAAAAAAGAVTAVVRRRRSGGGDEEQDERDDARLDDVEQVADELGGLVDALRSEFRGSGDYERLTEIADTISELADEAAAAFSRAAEGGDGDDAGRIGDELLQRVRELRGGGEEEGAEDEAREAEQEAPA